MVGAAAPATPAAPVAVFRLPLNGQPDPAAGAEPEDRAWIEPLLQQNAVWFCQLRWIVIVGLVLAGLTDLSPALQRAIGLTRSPALPLGAAALLAVLNVAFVRMTRRTAQPGAKVSVRLLLWAQIVSDLLVLTAVVHWLGHELSAAPFMYLFHIILACIVFTPRESLGVAGLAAAFYLISLSLELLGILPRTSLTAGADSLAVSTVNLGSGVGPMLLIWAVIWYLVSRLASALRSRDRALFLANHRLHASIEERSKHMLQTTHQLKAPFAAVHAQTQLLLGGYCGALPDAARAVAEKISARCLVLARQIQEMLQLANLRSQGQNSPPRRPVNLGRLIEEVITRIEPAARQRGIGFEKDVQPVTVHAVEDHLTMLVDNLVVNAVNYSFDRGVVQVTCRGQDSGDTIFVVRDQGIGIPKDKLPRIFDDYYRTEEAVQHNRGSTGLGLAIVRQVACEDALPVQVESAPGWGTRFTITFPGRSAAARSPISATNH
jgi:signal transduction histidine kinase